MKALDALVLIGGEGSGTSTVVSTLSTAFESISSDLMSTISTIAPIALGIVGAGIVLVFGVKWFKRLTNKA